MSPPLTAHIAGATDVGRRRSQNEDRWGTWAPDDPAERERRGVLLVVCDGMGGARAGEVASDLAVDTLTRAWRAAPGADPEAELVDALQQANAAVYEESTRKTELGGMGTTCTALVLRGADLFFAHVGDSRGYLVRGGSLRPLTLDHSLVAQLVREGHMSAAQARVDPRRNVVTRSVGVGPHVEIDGGHLAGALQPGDTLLVCSDGLHGIVEEQELARIVSAPDLQSACHEAIALANSRGGPDNITLALARIVSP